MAGEPESLDAVAKLIAAQHGLVATRQFVELEPHRGVRRRIERRLGLQSLTPNVWGSMLFADDEARRLLLRVLDAGPCAALWGSSAATWWGFGRFRLSPVSIARPRSSRHLRQPDDTEVHHVRSMGPVRPVRGVPASSPERTWLWLCGHFTERFSHNPTYALKKCEDVLEQAWGQGLIDGGRLHRLVENSGGRGRSGIVHARAALVGRPPDYRPLGSNTERRFLEILSPRDAERFSSQVPIRDHSPVGVVDFSLLDWPLIVEINGQPWHSSIPDRAADDVRYRRLLALGFSVLVWWDFDVWHDVAKVREFTAQLVMTPDAEPTLHRPTMAPWDVR